MPSTFLHGQQLLRCGHNLVRRALDGSGEVTVRLSTGIRKTGESHVQKLLPFCGGHRGEDVAEYESYGCINHSMLLLDHLERTFIMIMWAER